MSKSDSRSTWTRIWRTTKFQSVPAWDSLSQLVHTMLLSFMPKRFVNKVVVETGSGTGRVSLRLAEEGAHPILIDISIDAIMYSKKNFERKMAIGHFVVGDLSSLPLRDESVDAVWSSGVLEHYSIEFIANSLKESLRILKRSGSLIAIVPNKDAIVYNFSRRLDMLLKRWQYGYEEPLNKTDLEKVLHEKPITIKSSGFLHQFFQTTIPVIGFVVKRVLGFLLEQSISVAKLDQLLPGYLIGALWLKGQ